MDAEVRFGLNGGEFRGAGRQSRARHSFYVVTAACNNCISGKVRESSCRHTNTWNSYIYCHFSIPSVVFFSLSLISPAVYPVVRTLRITKRLATPTNPPPRHSMGYKLFSLQLADKRCLSSRTTGTSVYYCCACCGRSYSAAKMTDIKCYMCKYILYYKKRMKRKELKS